MQGQRGGWQQPAGGRGVGMGGRWWRAVVGRLSLMQRGKPPLRCSRGPWQGGRAGGAQGVAGAGGFRGAEQMGAPGGVWGGGVAPGRGGGWGSLLAVCVAGAAGCAVGQVGQVVEMSARGAAAAAEAVQAASPRGGTNCRKRVVVLGSGWGAVSFLKAIDAHGYDVTLISPRNFFLFTPLLPSVTTGVVEGRSIAEPIRRILLRCLLSKLTTRLHTSLALRPSPPSLLAARQLSSLPRSGVHGHRPSFDLQLAVLPIHPALVPSSPFLHSKPSPSLSWQHARFLEAECTAIDPASKTLSCRAPAALPPPLPVPTVAKVGGQEEGDGEMTRGGAERKGGGSSGGDSGAAAAGGGAAASGGGDSAAPSGGGAVDGNVAAAGGNTGGGGGESGGACGGAREVWFTVPYDMLVVAMGAVPNTFNVPGVQHHCHFLKAREGRCGGARKVHFTVPYDMLVVAVGARPNTFNVPGVQHHCHFLKVSTGGLGTGHRASIVPYDMLVVVIGPLRGGPPPFTPPHSPSPHPDSWIPPSYPTAHPSVTAPPLPPPVAGRFGGHQEHAH
ncbi:unnamed protein product [Closterium sp. NIES-53]